MLMCEFGWLVVLKKMRLFDVMLWWFNDVLWWFILVVVCGRFIDVVCCMM